MKGLNTIYEWGYEQKNLLGKGAFAEVYRVKQSATGKIMACKMSGEREMLRKEAEILERVKHSLFPYFCEYREVAEGAFLFMEYVPGMTLQKMVTLRKKLTQKQAIGIATSLAEGLLYLHEQTPSILFRDLKPENIMIREDGTVKLLDFGSADRGRTSLHVITGTQGYAAPEQWNDTVHADKCSDVYALGKVLFFMLGTGKVEKWLSDLLEDCIRQEPRERVPDMRCFLSRLKGKTMGKNMFVYQYNILRYLC